MAKSNTALYLPTAANNAYATIVNSDSTGLKTVFTAGANDSDIKALSAASDDTSTRVVKIWITRSGTDYLIGAISVTTLAGTNGSTGTIDLLDSSMMPQLPVDSAGKRYLPLQAGDVLKVSAVVAVTSGKTITVTALGQDY